MTTHEVIAPRLAALRTYMADHALDALIIPHDDDHLGEYTPAEAERLIAAGAGNYRVCGIALEAVGNGATGTDAQFEMIPVQAWLTK